MPAPVPQPSSEDSFGGTASGTSREFFPPSMAEQVAEVLTSVVERSKHVPTAQAQQVGGRQQMLSAPVIGADRWRGGEEGVMANFDRLRYCREWECHLGRSAQEAQGQHEAVKLYRQDRDCLYRRRTSRAWPALCWIG